MTTKRMHFLVAVLGFLAFLISGVYMKTRFPDIYGTQETIRYQFRANHIYLLLSALINLHAGMAWQPIAHRIRGLIQFTAGALLISAPIILTAAFWIEPAHGVAARPLSFYGILMLLAGTVMTLIARVRLTR